MSSTPEVTPPANIVRAGVAMAKPAAPHVHDASLWHLVLPKLQSARARSSRGEDRGRGARLTLLLGVGLLFWSAVLVVLTRLLTYFRGVPEIGPLFAGKLLGLICLSFFSILLLSNVITALSTFFLARDLDMLVGAPLDWLRLYLAKLAESVVHSSWMVTLMAVPIFTAYGYVYEGGAQFVVVALAAFLPFLIIPAVIGNAVTLILVNVFPARRTRDLLSVIAVLAAGGLVLLFRLLRPEQLVRPEGFRSLVEFIGLLRTPTSPFLPSEWVERGVMSALTDGIDALPFFMLWSTSAALLVFGAALHQRLYMVGFSKAQESTQRFARGTLLTRLGYKVLAPVGTLKRELVMKELRLFFRDSTQWSQLILLAVLVVVYIFNVKYLPLGGSGMTFFLVNVIPFLNLGLSGFVLASISARFIFPSISLEGRTLWLLKSSPMPMRSLLWAKYWTGTLPLLVLALGIVGITDVLLQVSVFMLAVSVASITLLTFAIASLALGLGAVFPQFETENAAQIPTSFGGLVFMMASVVLIGAVILLEARPVFIYLSAKALGTPLDRTEMVVGFSLAALLCLVTTFVPTMVARRRLEA